MVRRQSARVASRRRMPSPLWAPAAEQAKEPPIGFAAARSVPSRRRYADSDPRDRFNRHRPAATRAVDALERKAFDAAVMEDMLRQSMIDSAEKIDGESQAKRKEAREHGRGAWRLAPWRRDASKRLRGARSTAPCRARRQARGAGRQRAPSLARDRARPRPCECSSQVHKRAGAVVRPRRLLRHGAPTRRRTRRMSTSEVVGALAAAAKTHGLAVCAARSSRQLAPRPRQIALTGRSSRPRFLDLQILPCEARSLCAATAASLPLHDHHSARRQVGAATALRASLSRARRRARLRRPSRDVLAWSSSIHPTSNWWITAAVAR